MVQRVLTIKLIILLEFTGEQKLRENLGLTRRRSTIKPVEVLAASERLDMPSTELQRRHCTAGEGTSVIWLNRPCWCHVGGEL